MSFLDDKGLSYFVEKLRGVFLPQSNPIAVGKITFTTDLSDESKNLLGISQNRSSGPRISSLNGKDLYIGTDQRTTTPVSSFSGTHIQLKHGTNVVYFSWGSSGTNVRLANIGSPQSDDEAANKEYVDGNVSTLEVSITEHELNAIAQGQAMTDLELMILEGK